MIDAFTEHIDDATLADFARKPSEELEAVDAFGSP